MNLDVKSLKELSLVNIKYNFSRHLFAYLSTKDEILKKNLHFLQRVYSDDLYESFIGRMTIKHLDFLLNENIKQLKVRLSENFPTETFLRKIIPIAHNLKSVAVYEDTLVRGADLQTNYFMKSLFVRTTNIKEINIPFICNDEIIKLIATSCPYLEYLNIKNSTVTGAGTKELCLNPDGKIFPQCPMQSLNVNATSLEISDVAFLVQNLPTLKNVEYSKLPLVIDYLHLSHPEDKLSSNTSKFNLLALDFLKYEYSSDELTRVLTACIEKCTKVEDLKIGIFKSKDLETVAHFSSLKTLFVSKVFTNAPEMQTKLNLNSFLVSSGNGLTNLTIKNISLSISVLMENCPNLENLSMKSISFQEFDDKSNKILHKLRNVEFSYISFFDCVQKIL